MSGSVRKTQPMRDAPVRGHGKAVWLTKEPKIDPSKRVEEFPNQTLSVSETPNGRKLYCKACRDERSIRKSSITSHIASIEHMKNVAKYISTLSDDDQISMLIEEYFEKKPDAEMQTVSNDIHVYRWRVMETMLYAGVPAAKMDMLRKLLEREGHNLTDPSHMKSMFIPQIEDREIKLIVKELLEQHFSVIFDGTTRLGEAINIVTRSITDDFVIRMRLVAFKTTKVHCDGNALFRLILMTLQRILGLDLEYCVAWSGWGSTIGSSRDSGGSE